MTASVVGAQVCDFTCLPQRNSSTEIPFWSSVHESALPKGEKKNSCLDLKLKKKTVHFTVPRNNHHIFSFQKAKLVSLGHFQKHSLSASENVFLSASSKMHSLLTDN